MEANNSADIYLFRKGYIYLGQKDHTSIELTKGS